METKPTPVRWELTTAPFEMRNNDSAETANERDELKEENGLLKIEIDHTKTLLASCEKALADREIDLSTVEQLNSELLEALSEIVKWELHVRYNHEAFGILFEKAKSVVLKAKRQ